MQERTASIRRQAVFVRDSHIACAMSVGGRAKAHVKGLFGYGRTRHNNNNDNEEDEAPEGEADNDRPTGIVGGGVGGILGGRSKRSLRADDSSSQGGGGSKTGGKKRATQYRLEATSRAPKRHWLVRLLWCFGTLGLFGGGSRGQAMNENPNRKLAMYLHWMFRVNFVVLFTVMCVFFFGLVIVFSGFITLAGTIDNECVRIGGFNFSHAGTPFADAVRVLGGDWGILYTANDAYMVRQAHTVFL
jgi:hypothetical protein